MELYRRLPDVKKIYDRLRASAKKRGIVFNLSLSELNEIEYPFRCPIFPELLLDYHSSKVGDNTYSIDRIDSSRGYEDGNIRIISFKANRMKSDLGLDDLNKLIEYIRES